MERRELLATDLASITGVAFIDEAGDGSSAGDPPVAVGTQVQIFADDPLGAQPGVFDGGDPLAGTDFTDANGRYRFDRLTVGRYFVEQAAVPGLITPPAFAVDVTDAGGVVTALIDDYSQTDQSLAANAGTPNVFDSATATETIGNNRDISLTYTSGIQVAVIVDSASGTLSIGSQGGVGTAVIQYDGTESTAALDPTGLGGISLNNGDEGAGFIVLSRADQAGDTLTITVHGDASNSASAAVAIPQSLTDEEIFVPFSSFTSPPGQSVDFNNVGAIEVSTQISANTDVVVSITEARQTNLFQADIANIQPVTLGGRVFSDSSDTGQNNGLREGTEAGITGVTVELYSLADPNDVVDPTTTALTSFTTTTGGAFSFSGLDPGHYAVVVPASQFAGGATLFGFGNSTGNDPLSDPDDNVDEDDSGTVLPSGDVISGTITLVSNNEPIDDGDTDPNTNHTLDFGFFPQIDLGITKTVNTAASNLIAGGNVVFDIVVQNNGPLPATDVEVEDILPAGLTFTGIANESGSFTTTVNGQTVTVRLGAAAPGAATLPVGGAANFQLTADIANNQTDDITNTATVDGSEVETDNTNNSSSALLDLPSSDVRIQKTALTDPVNAGAQLTYQITVTNDGPDSAAGVVVTDPLPVGVTFNSGDVDGDSNLVVFDAPSRTVTAFAGTLANAASSVVTIVVDVAEDAVSPLTNNATVTVDPDTDPDQTNNTSGDTTTVEREVDVAVTKTVSGTPIAGQDVTYTLVVANNGPSQARGISVSDILDSDLTLVTGSFDPGTSGVTLSQNGQALTFDVGTLNNAASATFSFDVSIASSATGSIPNVAAVTTTDIDSDSTNDSSTVNMSVLQEVDLILEKSVDQTTAVPGQDQLVYTITLRHDVDSSSDATNVVVTDVLPAGLTGTVITDGTPPPDSTSFANNTVTVGYNSIPVGETRSFMVTVDVEQDATGTIVNPASVTSDGTDLDSSNNTDDAATALSPVFDIVVAKSVDDSTPNPGGTVVYTVGLTNEGPSRATGIVLTDSIPTGLTFVSGSLDGQSGVSNGSTVTFPAIDLDASGSETATLTFTVDASASGTLTNTASVPDLSGSGENDTSNNSDTADVTVTPIVDLLLTKSVTLQDAQIGSDLSYTITVTNNGPSQATNVEVVDSLPPGVTFTSGSGPNGETLTANNGVVTFNQGTLDDTASFSITINGTVAAGATGDQVNSATVTSDTDESNAADNTATATTTVDPLTSTIAGTVYVDLNNNGIQDAGEDGIAGVELVLSGVDSLGNAVNGTAATDASGNYMFSNLAEGTYTVTQTQPTGFRDGIETVGTGANATAADNVFAQIALGADTDAAGFNFGELNQPLSKRLFLASST